MDGTFAHVEEELIVEAAGVLGPRHYDQHGNPQVVPQTRQEVVPGPFRHPYVTDLPSRPYGLQEGRVSPDAPRVF